MQRVSGFPAEVHERLLEELVQNLARHDGKQRYFLARHRGVPVGATSLALISGVGHLFGAGVIPSHRGRGIYREMIRYRLAWLRDQGRKLATVHCVSTTSAPLCRRLGFSEVCSFETYRYPALLAPASR